MNATRKVKLKDIQVQLTCKICLGYLVEATTIIECLHSFCKSCIIKYLEKSTEENKYCPVCDIQLNSAKPLTSIRSDLMLQEIVYKLVPGLFKNEMRRRREFYSNNGDAVPANPLDSGQVFDESYITSDESMYLSLEYVTDDEKLRESTRRYLQCPAAVSIFVLKKLLHAKYDLDASTNIDIMYRDRLLPDDFLLMDVAYKCSWTKHGNKPLPLRYRIKGYAKPVMKIEKTLNESVQTTPSDNNSKSDVPEEVQTPQTNKKKVCNENGSNIMPSENTKPLPIKPPPNGRTWEAVKTQPGKVRGRKRKNLSFSNVHIESKDDFKLLTKKPKIKGKSPLTRSPSDPTFNAQTQMEIIPITNINNNNNNSNDDSPKDTKEVQLQISETGIFSARSISSSNKDDKIVYDLSRRKSTSPFPTATSTTASAANPSPKPSQTEVCPTEKLLLSGNFYSQTGPSGVTEIICNKPDPGSSSVKPPSAKPGYVTLNIPSPKIPVVSYQNLVKNNMLNGNANCNIDKKIDESSTATKHDNVLGNNKPDALELSSKGTEGNSSSAKLLAGSRKLSNSSAATNTDFGSISGRHSLQNAPLSSSILSQCEISTINGSDNSNDKVILPLNLSPTSGMSVTKIPSAINTSNPSSQNLARSTNGSSTNLSNSTSYTPRKLETNRKLTSNGKFQGISKLPKLLPKPTINQDEREKTTPKKPAKFFKNRQKSSTATSPPLSSALHQGDKRGSPAMVDDFPAKRKSPYVPLKNGAINANDAVKTGKDSKHHKETSPMISMDTLLNLMSAQPSTGSMFGTHNGSNNDAAIGLPYCTSINAPQLPNQLAHHITALNNLITPTAASNQLNTTSFGIAAAAAAAVAAANSNGSNGLGSYLPFIADNFGSLAYVNNQRHPMTNFPYGYAAPINGFPTQGLSPTTTTAGKSVNSSHQIEKNASKGSRILSDLLAGSPCKETQDANRDSGSGQTLDLSLHKLNSPQHVVTTSSPPKEKANTSEANPLLVSLLNSKSTTPMDVASKIMVSPKSNEKTNSKTDKSKSPIIRQLLETSEHTFGNNDHVISPKGTTKDQSSPNQCISKDAKNPMKANGTHTTNGEKKEKANDVPVNGFSPKTKDNTCVQISEKASSDSKSTTASPETSNDKNGNTRRGNDTEKVLDKDALFCLSAQNNNVAINGNNNTSKDPGSLDCSNTSSSHDKVSSS